GVRRPLLHPHGGILLRPRPAARVGGAAAGVRPALAMVRRPARPARYNFTLQRHTAHLALGRVYGSKADDFDACLGPPRQRPLRDGNAEARKDIKVGIIEEAELADRHGPARGFKLESAVVV